MFLIVPGRDSKADCRARNLAEDAHCRGTKRCYEVRPEGLGQLHCRVKRYMGQDDGGGVAAAAAPGSGVGPIAAKMCGVCVDQGGEGAHIRLLTATVKATRLRLPTIIRMAALGQAAPAGHADGPA